MTCHRSLSLMVILLLFSLFLVEDASNDLNDMTAIGYADDFDLSPSKLTLYLQNL